jgi:multimeric flavodoxin WrbA
MKAIAINGSPRKNWNTATLLQKALEGAQSMGAETEFIHLYDLNFKGCTSCFACKRKDNRHIGQCAMKDDLTPVLEKIVACDVLFLGSPIYFGNISGEMHSFLERLMFSNLAYTPSHGSLFTGKVSSAFIYTMNVSDVLLKQYNYDTLFNYYQNRLQFLNGTTEFLLSTDTYQFDDYSVYETSMFDEKHKAQVKANQYPLDCKKAYDIGARLVKLT